MNWISVKDGLPDKYCKDGTLYNFHALLVCLENGCVCEAWWNGFDFAAIDRPKNSMSELFKDFNPVTHWAPLPNPANGGAEVMKTCNSCFHKKVCGNKEKLTVNHCPDKISGCFCEECKWWTKKGGSYCNELKVDMCGRDFCSCGEKKEV